MNNALGRPVDNVIDVDKRENLHIFRIRTAPTPPSSNVILSNPVFLRKFTCDIAANSNFASQVDFYDSSNADVSGAVNMFGFVLASSNNHHD